jgi:hypothetical protein
MMETFVNAFIITTAVVAIISFIAISILGLVIAMIE